MEYLVVVKDQIETAGIMTTFGSVAMDGYVPKEDATIISKLKDAGAIILAKTTMPDFATSWFGYSSKSGVSKTRMIWRMIQEDRVGYWNRSRG